jgi:putative membrane protein
MTEPAIIWEATFDERIKPYTMWSTILICTVTVVLIPLAILYLFIGNWYISRYLANLGCTLTERTLEIKKGILNKTESTIPLEKITDLQMFQGPIMRHFGLHGFKVETAGQSSTAGSLVNIIGIVDAVKFRKSVLDQRDRLANSPRGAHMAASSTPPSGSTSGGHGAIGGPEVAVILSDIRDTLGRIETKMGERT